MARRRHKNGVANGSVGRPRKVAIPTRQEELRPENAPSLMTYYKRRGKLKETTKAQMFKARHLFITKALNSREVAKRVSIPIQIVEQWIVIFDWQERRDRLLFNSYRKVHTLAKDRAQNIDERHDRIAGTMETLIERLMHDHLDPEVKFALGPKDLNGLARAIRELQGIRRLVHDKPTAKVDINKKLTLDTTDNFNNMAGMVEGLLGAKPQLEDTNGRKKLDVSFPGGIQDAEFEYALENEEA